MNSWGLDKMARILYGAPESEREEDNELVAKLRDRKAIRYGRSGREVSYVREKNHLEYANDFLGFAWESTRCKDSILLPQQYDLVIYDCLLYGENWLPEIRAEHFKLTITPFLVRSTAPIVVLADEEIKENIRSWAEDHNFHYVAQPYSIDEVVEKVNSLLPRPSRKKQ